jgi:hypothetical protein
VMRFCPLIKDEICPNFFFPAEIKYQE